MASEANLRRQMRRDVSEEGRGGFQDHSQLNLPAQRAVLRLPISAEFPHGLGPKRPRLRQHFLLCSFFHAVIDLSCEPIKGILFCFPVCLTGSMEGLGWHALIRRFRVGADPAAFAEQATERCRLILPVSATASFGLEASCGDEASSSGGPEAAINGPIADGRPAPCCEGAPPDMSTQSHLRHRPAE